MDAVLSNKTSLDAIAAGSGLAVLGAWLGAIPIPLDWDRDWQAWPVTVLAGAWMGYVVGVVLGGTVLWGWRLGRSSGKS